MPLSPESSPFRTGGTPQRSNLIAKRLRRIRSKAYNFIHQDDPSLPYDSNPGFISPESYGPYEINGNDLKKCPSFESLTSVKPDELLGEQLCGEICYSSGETMVCSSRKNSFMEYPEIEEERVSSTNEKEENVILEDFELPPMEYQKSFLLEEIEELLPKEYSLKREPSFQNSLTMYRAMLRLRRVPPETEKSTCCQQEHIVNSTNFNKDEELSKLKVEHLVQKTLLEQARKARAFATLAKYDDREYLAAEKALLMAYLKCEVIEKELNKLQNSILQDNSSDDLLGQASISEIRLSVPFAWESHYLILVGIEGSTVRCTDLERESDSIGGHYRSTTALNFYNLKPDFCMELRLYGIKTEYAKISKKPFYRSTDRLALFHKQHKSSSSNNSRSRLVNLLAGHNFTLFGSNKVQLFHLKQNQLTFQTSTYHIPATINGDVDFAIHHSGFLSIKRHVAESSNPPLWIRYWFRLEETNLSGWLDPEHFPSKEPIEKLNLCHCTSSTIVPVDRFTSIRPHTCIMEFKDEQGHHRIFLSADSEEDIRLWCDFFNRALRLCRPFYLYD